MCCSASNFTGIVTRINAVYGRKASINSEERMTVVLCSLSTPPVVIFAFFGKKTPYGKIFKILFRKFSPRHRSTLFCSHFAGNRSNRTLFTRQKKQKNRLLLKFSLLLGLYPKFAKATPQQCAQSAPYFIQIGLRLAEL